jgi:sulfite reductase (NADPH) hemoprotein beta-component
VGGNESSTRINKIYKDLIKDAEIVGELKALFQRWKETRIGSERFGDWSARVLWPEIDAAAAAAVPVPAAPAPVAA